jgi:hypothetical protein
MCISFEIVHECGHSRFKNRCTHLNPSIAHKFRQDRITRGPIRDGVCQECFLRREIPRNDATKQFFTPPRLPELWERADRLIAQIGSHNPDIRALVPRCKVIGWFDKLGIVDLILKLSIGERQGGAPNAATVLARRYLVLQLRTVLEEDYFSRGLLSLNSRDPSKTRSPQFLNLLFEIDFPQLPHDRQECPICCNSFSDCEKDRPVSTPCGHVFGKACIFTWLEEQTSCPTCRKEIYRHEKRPAVDPVEAEASNRPAPWWLSDLEDDEEDWTFTRFYDLNVFLSQYNLYVEPLQLTDIGPVLGEPLDPLLEAHLTSLGDEARKANTIEFHDNGRQLIDARVREERFHYPMTAVSTHPSPS